MKKIYFRTNGFAVEFHKFDRYLVFYNIKKILSFVVDMLIYVSFVCLLLYAFKIKVLSSFLYSYLIFLLITIFQMFLLKNKTIGMLLAGLVVGAHDLGEVPKNKYLIRGFVYSLYAIPILGIVMAVTSLVTMFISKGITITDVATKTQVYSKPYYKLVRKIMSNIEEEEWRL